MKRAALYCAFVLVLAQGLSAQLTPTPTQKARWPIVAEVNGDGLSDVIDDATVEINTGGALAAPAKLPITGRVLDALDVNGDGASELLTTADPLYTTPPQGPYTLWLNDGRGNFTAMPVPSAALPAANGPTGTVNLPPFIADFDGDGKDDLILAYPHLSPTREVDLRFFRSRGDGTFQETDFLTISTVDRITTSTKMRQHIAAADMNGDGKPDIVMVAGGEITIVAGKGDGKFGVLSQHLLPWTYIIANGVQVADIDGDGNPDVIWATDDGRVSVLFSDGHARFVRLVSVQSGDATNVTTDPLAQTLALVHYSSSHRYDIAVGAPHGLLVVLTYSKGALREATRVKLLDPMPSEPNLIPLAPSYQEVNVFAGKFRASSASDLYIFDNWDGPSAKAAWIASLETPADTGVRPPRRRVTRSPGTSVRAESGTVTLRIVPGYVDLASGRCYGVPDLYEIERDGAFGTGKRADGGGIDIAFENDDTLFVGSLSSTVPSSVFKLVEDGHYRSTTSWPTQCGNFQIQLDAYVTH